MVDKNELWYEILGGGWEQGSDLGENWIKEVTYLSGDWDKPGVVVFTAENGDGEIITKTLTPDDFLEAYKESVRLGYHHCGASFKDVDSADACWSDGIIQVALFGELVYG